jgi:hypothetical protein
MQLTGFKIKLYTMLVFSIITLLCFITACDTNYPEEDFSSISTIQNTPVAQQQEPPPYKPVSDREDFAKALYTLKVTLTPQDYQQIKALVNVVPTGIWTPGPENNSEKNKTGHFLKHANDFKPPFKSVEDYYDSAISFANSPEGEFYLDTNAYNQAREISVVKWSKITKEFTVLRANGQIATYFINNKLNPKRFVLISEDLK